MGHPGALHYLTGESGQRPIDKLYAPSVDFFLSGCIVQLAASSNTYLITCVSSAICSLAGSQVLFSMVAVQRRAVSSCAYGKTLLQLVCPPLASLSPLRFDESDSLLLAAPSNASEVPYDLADTTFSLG